MHLLFCKRNKRFCRVEKIMTGTDTPVAFKTWCGHQYRVGIICPPGWDRVKMAAKTWCGHVHISTGTPGVWTKILSDIILLLKKVIKFFDRSVNKRDFMKIVNLYLQMTILWQVLPSIIAVAKSRIFNFTNIDTINIGIILKLL